MKSPETRAEERRLPPSSLHSLINVTILLHSATAVTPMTSMARMQILLLVVSALLLSSAAFDSDSKFRTREIKLICVDSGVCMTCSKDEMVSIIRRCLSLFESLMSFNIMIYIQ